MRKNIFGRRFKRDKNERKALFKSLHSSLVLKKRITTTEEKAKAIRGEIDKVVTKVKKHGKNSQKFLGKKLHPDAFSVLVSEMLPHLSKRQSGYTRIIRMGKRFNDNAQMVIMEWVDEFPTPMPVAIAKKPKAEPKKKVVAVKAEKKTETKKTKPKTSAVKKGAKK